MNSPHLSRRGLISALGIGAAGIGAASLTSAPAALAASPSRNSRPTTPRQTTYSFTGEHQAGIATAAQENLRFTSLNVTTNSRSDLIDLLRTWTVAAAAMTQGREVGATGALKGSPDLAPDDTGEALDLGAAGLTITFGFGSTLFRTTRGQDRFGIAGQQPATLKPLPAFSADELQEGISGGDICIQACSDDAQVALHAVRNLARLAEGAATVAWSQSGFGKSSTLARDGKTPRNLFGFKDGTANIRSNSDFDDFVWASSGDGPAWMAGGTYLVARKVEMILDTWDNEDLTEQQEVFGRTKGTGAPLSGGSERTRPNFRATGANGEPMIDPHSHIALAAPGRAGRILRRGYNYAEGTHADGTQDAGLFFIAFMRDIDRQFVPMQRRLADSDLMNEYVRYRSGTTFAIPPGVRTSQQYVGQSLFG